MKGSAAPARTVVIGLGNPILGDDGVGWRVAERLRQSLADTPLENIEVAALAVGGIALMEHLIGYERAILIDAFVSEAQPGTLLVSTLEALPDRSAFHMTSVHDMSLQQAMQLGRDLQARLPATVTVVGISARHVSDFSEELSPPLAEAVPRAVRLVLGLLAQKITLS